MTHAAGATNPWMQQLGDAERALAGGFLFAIPLIYTLEAWDVGADAGPLLLLAFFAVTFMANLTLIRVSGFKEQTTFGNVAVDALEAMALGILGAFILLVAIDRIGSDTPWQVAAGRILIQSLPISLGVSLSNLFLRRRDQSRTGDDNGEPQSETQALVTDIGATLIGAVFICYAIAPTDEVEILARDLRPIQILFLVLLSLLTSFAIVFQAEFSNFAGRHAQPGPFQRPITETVLAYVVSLFIAFLLLFLFNQIDTDTDWRTILDQVLVLGFPATIGGAAGRLAV